MKIQKNISATMKREMQKYRNQAEFAAALDVGHTTFQALLAGKGNPSAETIEILAQGMGITPAELISEGPLPLENAFTLISGMVDSLHPSLYETGAFLLESMFRLFRLSEQRDMEEKY